MILHDPVHKGSTRTRRSPPPRPLGSSRAAAYAVLATSCHHWMHRVEPYPMARQLSSTVIRSCNAHHPHFEKAAQHRWTCSMSNTTCPNSVKLGPHTNQHLNTQHLNTKMEHGEIEKSKTGRPDLCPQTSVRLLSSSSYEFWPTRSLNPPSMSR